MFLGLRLSEKESAVQPRANGAGLILVVLATDQLLPVSCHKSHQTRFFCLTFVLIDVFSYSPHISFVLSFLHICGFGVQL